MFCFSVSNGTVTCLSNGKSKFNTELATQTARIYKGLLNSGLVAEPLSSVLSPPTYIINLASITHFVSIKFHFIGRPWGRAAELLPFSSTSAYLPWPRTMTGRRGARERTAVSGGACRSDGCSRVRLSVRREVERLSVPLVN
ncbi:hypothetical protein BaRGS_00029311 [Batillaria attramentaria]|uniref:Uncharacterized protein n=1 Tax=Batillaria attramentaria TaxID=370345 RepID=A0ABD0JWL7_9CAEN